jgi:hypothetical protein
MKIPEVGFGADIDPIAPGCKGAVWPDWKFLRFSMIEDPAITFRANADAPFSPQALRTLR